MDELITLSVLELDCPSPPGGWVSELARRGIVVQEDDLGRAAIARVAARGLLTEHRENEARKARHRAEMERQAVEADRAFRAQLPRGIPVDAVPEGLTAAQLMMLSDPTGEEQERESVLEHSLKHRDGAIIYHTVEGSAS